MQMTEIASTAESSQGERSVRWRIHQLLQITPSITGHTRTVKVVSVALCSLILLNVLAMILETVEHLSTTYGVWFEGFEAFSIIVFSVEYLLRIWSVTAAPQYRHPVWGRVRFALTPMAVLDVLAILPFYLPMLLPDLRFARAFRALRVARALRIGRYSESIATIGRVMAERRHELIVVVTAVLVLLVVSASLMYVVEGDAQPAAFSSIPASLWWAIATLTTVGYGDVLPITPLGKVLAGVIAFLGIGLFALPAGILASGFAAELERRRVNVHKRCPHCGRELQ